MGLFNLFRREKSDTGAGNAEYSLEGGFTNLPDILSYEDCRNIYKYWALGKRVAKALPNFALSAQRTIIFEDMPEECIKLFQEAEKDLQIHRLLKEVLTNIRIFGISGICVVSDKDDLSKKLTYSSTIDKTIAFNIVDPLNLTGSQIGIDPTKLNYQKVSSIKVNGQDVDLSRAYIGFNDHLFYLDYVPSNFNFGSISIYQNMISLIYDWNKCVTALERISTKAGSILVRNRDGGVLNSISTEAARKTLEAIRNMRNDGIASINNSDSVELFNLAGVGEVDAIIERLNNCIMMALSDTPSAILLDERLAKGFGDGTEDMKAILMAVEDYRESQIRPIYNFLDKYLLYLTFTPKTLQKLKEDYSEFKSMSLPELREAIFNSFSFEWGNLYPESEATKTDNMARKLDNLLKLRDLGANLEDIEAIINADPGLYNENITLDAPLEEDMEGEDETNSISQPSKAPSPSSDEE